MDLSRSGGLARAVRHPGVQLLLYALALTVMGLVGILLRPTSAPIGLWWPGAGIATAGLLLTARRHQPLLVVVILLTGTATHRMAGLPVAEAIGLALLNPVGPVIAAEVLRFRRTDPRALRDQDDLLRLLLAILLASAVVGLLTATTFGQTSELPLVVLIPRLASTVAASMFLFLPLVMRTGRTPVEAGRPEVAAQWVTTVVTTLLVFGPGQQRPLAFLLLPVLLWPALRSTVRVTIAQLMVALVLVTRLSQAGHGPFATVDGTAPLPLATTMTLVQILVASSAVVLLTVLVAVGQRRSAHAEAGRREELFRVGFDRSLLGQILLRLDASGVRIVELNGVAARLLDAPVPALLGSGFLDALELDDRTRIELDLHAMLAGEVSGWRGEVRIGTHQGPRWVAMAIAPIAAGGTGRSSGGPSTGLFAAQLIDVTERRAAENRLNALALHDDLTGLANRQLLDDRLSRAVTEAASRPHAVGVLFIDLDGFKAINDTDGHEVGDAVLVALAARLRGVVRANDTVARIGGDEFVIVSPGLVSAAVLDQVRHRIEAALSAPIPINGLTHRVGASIGSAVNEPGDTAADILARADAQMYAQKARTRAGRVAGSATTAT